MPCFFFILLAAINLKIFFLLKVLNFYTVKIFISIIFGIGNTILMHR